MSSSPITVLLIEDNADDAELISEMLVRSADKSFALSRVSRLDAGERHLSANDPPDVILLDLALPDSKGVITLRRVRALVPQVAIIVLTGQENEQLGLETILHGAQDYLPKSELNGEILARVIRYAMYRKQTETELREQRDNLEMLVSKRTAELLDLNQKLQQDIEMRKQTEIALLESQGRLQALFDMSLDAILLLDDQAHVIDANPAAFQLTGYSGEELLRRSALDLIPISEGLLGKEMWRNFLSASQAEGEFTMQCKNGITIETEYRAVAHIVPGIHMMLLRDITERKRAEEELRFMKFAVDNAPDAIFIINQDATFRYVNSAALETLGYTESELLELSLADVAPDYHEEGWRAFLDSARQAEYLRVEADYRSSDGEITPVEVTLKNMVFRGEEYQAAFARNITERKMRESELKQKNDFLQSILNNSTSLIVVRDVEGRYMLINRQTELLTGKTESDFLGATPYDIHKPSVAKKLLEVDRMVLESMKPFKLEEVLELPTQTRTFIKSIVPLCDDSGAPYAVCAVSTDITDRKHAEYQLRKLNEELENRVTERTARLQEANEKLAQTATSERAQRALAEALRDITATLNSTLDFDEVLDSILANIEQVVPHDAANVMLIEDGYARILRSRGYTAPHQDSPELTHNQFTISEISVLKQMAQTGQPVLLPDISGAPYPVLDAQTKATRSYIGAPITWQNETLGFLNLESDRENFYNLKQAERLRAFANQAAIAIRNAQVHTQAQELAALRERQRLARDLHDAVSQTLWSASLIADVLPVLWKQDVEKGHERLLRLNQLTRGAQAEMRALLLELRPASLRETPLVELLHHLAAAAASRTKADVSMDAQQGCELPADVHEAMYRIAQETLNNIARHALATEIQIKLDCTECDINLEIGDNGRGFDLTHMPSGQHLGIGIMRERAEFIGARLDITSEPGRGTKVRASWKKPEGEIG